MNFLEKLFPKKDSPKDIEGTIADINVQIEQKTTELRLLKKNMDSGRVPRSPINVNNLKSLESEVGGLSDKLIIAEEKKRLAEERGVEKVSQ